MDPIYGQARKPLPESVVNSIDTLQHPQLAWMISQEQQQRRQTEIERSRLLPAFTIGYSNQSIVGYQKVDAVNEKYFSRSHRFSVVSLSVGIPLFNRVTKSRIRASERQEEAARLRSEATRVALDNQREAAQKELNKWSEQIQFHESAGKARVYTLLSSAEQAFHAGEIGYIEWSMLINQATQLRISHAEAIAGYNRALIQLEYLTGKITP